MHENIEWGTVGTDVNEQNIRNAERDEANRGMVCVVYLFVAILSGAAGFFLREIVRQVGKIF